MCRCPPPPCLQSQKGAELIWRFPILLDACANEVQRQGDAMMSKWAEVRLGCGLPGLLQRSVARCSCSARAIPCMRQRAALLEPKAE